MDKMKKEFTYFFILVLVVCLICFLIPMQMGRIEVIKTLIKYVCMVVIGILFIVMGILPIIQKTKVRYSALIVIFGIMLVALGPFGCSNAIRGLQAGPKVIENGNYELAHSSHKGFTSYYLTVTPDNGNGSVKIKVDKNTYQYLNTNKSNLTISYYPYVNIVNEVVYK